MSETIGIPFYIILSGISALISLGIVLGAFSSRFVLNTKCEQRQECCRADTRNMVKDLSFKIDKLEEHFEKSIVRVHSRLDEVILKLEQDDE
jgi:hypothetical protein